MEEWIHYIVPLQVYMPSVLFLVFRVKVNECGGFVTLSVSFRARINRFSKEEIFYLYVPSQFCVVLFCLK